jgi:hypothetical protein
MFICPPLFLRWPEWPLPFNHHPTIRKSCQAWRLPAANRAIGVFKVALGFVAIHVRCTTETIANSSCVRPWGLDRRALEKLAAVGPSAGRFLAVDIPVAASGGAQLLKLQAQRPVVGADAC